MKPKTLAPWKKSYDKHRQHLKSRDITLPTKVHMTKATIFPGVMYGCKNWTAKKAECQRIDAFKLWYWRRLLRVPWTARRSNQSILKEINPEYSLEGLMLNLKLQYFGHLLWRAYSTGKDPDARKDWGQEEKGMTGDEMAEGTIDSTDMSLSKLQETMKDREAWRSAAHGVTKNQTQQRDWTTTNGDSKKISSCLESGERSWWIGGTQRIFRTVKLFCMIL